MTNVILEAIAIDISTLQMSKCCKVTDCQTDEDFYQIESSKGENEYEVRYDVEKGFTCTCEAGRHGFWNCRNYCRHVRASVACHIAELKAEKAARAIENNVPAWVMR